MIAFILYLSRVLSVNQGENYTICTIKVNRNARSIKIEARIDKSIKNAAIKRERTLVMKLLPRVQEIEILGY